MSIFIKPEGMSDVEYIKVVSLIGEEMTMLLRTAGWKRYEEYLKGEIAAIEHSLDSADTGDKALRAAGALKVLRGALAFPTLLVSQAHQMLQGDTK